MLEARECVENNNTQPTKNKEGGGGRWGNKSETFQNKILNAFS